MRTEWQAKSLGDVCDIIGGGTPSKDNPAFYAGDIPWATVRDMRSEMLSATEFKITKEAVLKSSTNIIPANNVVIATRVGLGKVCLLVHDTAVNQDLRGVIPKTNELDPTYLFRWFQSVAHEIVSEGTGATVQGVKLPFIKSLQIPIPPKAEQKRIVALLDEAFTGLDAAIANTTKNLANARELFDSYWDSAFLRQSNDSVATTLGDEVDLLVGFAFKSNEYTDLPTDVRLLRGDNIIQGKLRWRDVKRFPKSRLADYDKYALEKDDVVLAMDRTWVKAGLKFAQISEEDLPSLLVQRVARLRAREGLERKFLHYLIGSTFFTKYVLSIQTGLGVPHISGKQISDFQFHLPSPREQQKIAGELEELEQSINRLELIYQQKLDSLTELKQSLLHQAFTGAL